MIAPDLPATVTAAPEVEFPAALSSEGCQQTSVAESVAPVNEPEAGPSHAEALRYSVRATANHVMDCVLAEFRARPVVHTRLGNVAMPDFSAGEARIGAPRFWDLNAVFREGDACMRSSPYTPGELPDEVRLRSRVSCRGVKFQCDFMYSYFRGQASLSFGRVLIGVLLVLRGGFPHVKSLQVEDIGEIDVVSLLGVPAVLKWLATKVIKKVIRENSQVIARLASNEFKDVLQEAVGDQDLGSVLKETLATEYAKPESSGRRKSSV
ncbi:uncharacterized protein LOC142775759 [Rhipicephalus microplus]|uniref:uncharacterized protein LOC142775759 n=1 Tax=Rhipicephalus microplus TaxID=6941 RepID=UPI003F6AA3EE